MSQHAVMKFDPGNGSERPYPSHARQYREHHGAIAWLFNPWTGERRHAADVGSDAFGHLIVPPLPAVTLPVRIDPAATEPPFAIARDFSAPNRVFAVGVAGGGGGGTVLGASAGGNGNAIRFSTGTVRADRRPAVRRRSAAAKRAPAKAKAKAKGARR